MFCGKHRKVDLMNRLFLIITLSRNVQTFLCLRSKVIALEENEKNHNIQLSFLIFLFLGFFPSISLCQMKHILLKKSLSSFDSIKLS